MHASLRVRMRACIRLCVYACGMCFWGLNTRLPACQSDMLPPSYSRSFPNLANIFISLFKIFETWSGCVKIDTKLAAFLPQPVK